MNTKQAILRHVMNERDVLKAQRDELLAACKALCDRLETMQRAARSCDQHEPARKLGPFHREWLGDGIVSDARAAIMRAEKATP